MSRVVVDVVVPICKVLEIENESVLNAILQSIYD